jgi:hypothetical protein
MGFVNLKEMAKRAKKTEEEIMELVEIGVIQPHKSYCYPAHFGDGKAIAFYPDEALVDIKEAKSKPKPEPEPEPEPEELEPEEDEEKGEPEPKDPEEEDETAEAPVPEEPKKKEPKGKDKKPEKK